MHKEHEIVAAVTAAKKDREKADALLRDYLPFIRAQAAKQVGHPVSDQDDAQSIAMIAFHEAILGYDPGRGAFLPYAAMVIKSRIIDHQRREARHQGQLSLDAEQGDDSRPLLEEVADTRDRFAEAAGLAATQKEIAELAAVMAEFGVSFSDVAEQSPKQARTLEACTAAVRYAAAHESLLEELLRTKKLPLAALVRGAGDAPHSDERVRDRSRTSAACSERRASFMKYLVMESEPGYAIVLDEEGRFLRVANQGYAVGETLTEVSEMAAPAAPKRRFGRYLAAVAMVACLLFAALGVYEWQQPFASVYMTINPEVRIDVDRDEMVVGLDGVNDDGADLVSGYAYDDKSLELVMDELVDRAIEMGYLSEGGTISLTLDADSDEWIVSRSDSLSTQLNAHLDEKLSVTIYVTNQETSQQTGSDYGDSDYAEAPTVVDVPQQPAQPAQEPTAPVYAEGDSAYEDDDYEDGDSGYEADDD